MSKIAEQYYFFHPKYWELILKKRRKLTIAGDVGEEIYHKN